MKVKMWFIMGGVVLVFMLSGCSESSPSETSPAESVQLFYQYAENGEIDRARSFVAEDTVRLIESSPMYGTVTQGIIREAEKYESIEPIETEVNGQTASVTVKATFPNGTEDTVVMNLIHEDEAWRLTFQ